jgi:hypothetical protein
MFPTASIQQTGRNLNSKQERRGHRSTAGRHLSRQDDKTAKNQVGTSEKNDRPMHGTATNFGLIFPREWHIAIP